MKTQTALFERFEIELPLECVADCSHRGACDEDGLNMVAGALDYLAEFHSVECRGLSGFSEATLLRNLAKKLEVSK